MHFRPQPTYCGSQSASPSNLLNWSYMLGFVPPRQLLAALVFLAMAPSGALSQDGDGGSHASLQPPRTETFFYTVEWRLINAGSARLSVAPSGTPEYPSLHSQLELTSAGLVSKLYKVEDKYFGNYDYGFCAISSQMTSLEGHRRRETRISFDRAKNKAEYLERDLIKNATVHAGEIDVPHCVHDVIAALLAMRKLHLEPGKSAEMPVSDGKRSASVRIEAQEREDVRINDKVHKTVRYEAYLFNGVLYGRKARLFIWLTDDEKKTPVQIRVRMNFPIGTVTLSLDKIEQS